MIARSFFYALHRNYTPPLSRHARNSANILSRVSKRLDEKGIAYDPDPKWPFHIIVHVGGKELSVFAGGWGNRIDILQLKKKSGSPFNAKYENCSLTPEGAVNLILRKYGNKDN